MMSQIENDTTRPGPGQGVSVPAMVYPYKAGLIGGALGGAAMVIVAVAYGLLTGRLWLPVNLVGATVVRDLQTASLEVEARIVDFKYGEGPLPPESYFERLTIELRAWPRGTLARS